MVTTQNTGLRSEVESPRGVVILNFDLGLYKHQSKQELQEEPEASLPVPPLFISLREPCHGTWHALLFLTINT